jgi:hypothetical protein
MADTTIVGTTLDGPKERDAIHVAVAAVIAQERLYPGQHIGLCTFDNHEQVSSKAPPIGIVDPFLPHPISAGERFWMFLYPQSITSLKHVWTHPAFVNAPPTAVSDGAGAIEETDEVGLSRKWIADFADGHDVTYNRMMKAAKEWVEYGEWFCDGGRFEGESVPDIFWTHYERVTGTKVDADKKENFFTCSC